MKIKARCKWACVHKPNTIYTPRWSITAVVTPEQAKLLADHGLIAKVDSDGDLAIKFKRLTVLADGSAATPPIVVDSKNKPMTAAIGNGSLVNIQVSLKYSNVHKRHYGILEGVQVLDLVPYIKASEFEEEDGGYVVPAAAEQPNASTDPSPVSRKAVVFDDDLPIQL